jgi:hypothetical protein
VNAQIAHTFAIDPLTIVKERRALDLTYGDEFLFHELLAAGFDPAQIASQLHSNLSITQVAQSLHADWKRIASDASRFNKSMNDAVYTYFTVEGRRVSAPGEYSPVTDWIKRDATGYQQDDLAWAINTFLSSRSRALRNTGQDGSLGELDYNSFHDRDHIKEKMPPPPPLPSATAARH